MIPPRCLVERAGARSTSTPRMEAYNTSVPDARRKAHRATPLNRLPLDSRRGASRAGHHPRRSSTETIGWPPARRSTCSRATSRAWWPASGRSLWQCEPGAGRRVRRDLASRWASRHPLGGVPSPRRQHPRLVRSVGPASAPARSLSVAHAPIEPQEAKGSQRLAHRVTAKRSFARGAWLPGGSAGERSEQGVRPTRRDPLDEPLGRQGQQQNRSCHHKYSADEQQSESRKFQSLSPPSDPIRHRSSPHVKPPFGR